MPVKMKMKIHLEFDDNGKPMITVLGEDNKPIPEALDSITDAIKGKTVLRKEDQCAIFFTQSSPVCVYFKLGGKYYRRCTS